MKDLYKNNIALHRRIEELEGELNKLQQQLNTAVDYLKQGKAQFAPSTTNSLVDDFIAAIKAEKGEQP